MNLCLFFGQKERINKIENSFLLMNEDKENDNLKVRTYALNKTLLLGVLRATPNILYHFLGDSLYENTFNRNNNKSLHFKSFLLKDQGDRKGQK